MLRTQTESEGAERLRGTVSATNEKYEKKSQFVEHISLLNNIFTDGQMCLEQQHTADLHRAPQCTAANAQRCEEEEEEKSHRGE